MTTSPACRVRVFEEADRPAIEAMSAEVVCAGRQFCFERVELVLGYWFAAGSSVFVAETEAGVLGTYSLKPNQPGRGAHVANAGYMVAEAARGQGLGFALGEHSIGSAREAGFRSMQFNFVTACNPSAVRLWQRLGFEIVGTLPAVFRLDSGELVDAFVMRRAL